MEVAVSLTVVLGGGAAAATALDMPGLLGKVEATTVKASCHTMRNAVAAYTTDHGRAPARITDVQPYVRGDLTPYRVTATGVTGPGCGTATR
jgi:hypothetical protein